MAAILKLKELGWYFTESGFNKITENGKISDVKQIINFALDNDMREYGGGAFPTELSKGGHKIEQISADIIVQIIKIRNIAAPKANEESKVAPRLLKLDLTDGQIQFSALEYESIPALSLNTPPGTKVFLKNGPIKIAQGFLLLKSNNVNVVGGNVPALVEKWEIGRTLSKYAKGNRINTGSSGPPPWIPFGQKIQQTITNSKTFKSLTERDKEIGKENDGFNTLRSEAIAEATKIGTKKVFGGGNKQMLDHGVQRIIDKGYSEEQAKYALKLARTNVDKAIRILRRQDESKLRSEGKGERMPREERGGRRGKNDIVEPTKPSNKVSLFDFLEDKLPQAPEPVVSIPVADDHSKSYQNNNNSRKSEYNDYYSIAKRDSFNHNSSRVNRSAPSMSSSTNQNNNRNNNSNSNVVNSKYDNKFENNISASFANRQKKDTYNGSSSLASGKSKYDNGRTNQSNSYNDNQNNYNNHNNNNNLNRNNSRHNNNNNNSRTNDRDRDRGGDRGGDSGRGADRKDRNERSGSDYSNRYMSTNNNSNHSTNTQPHTSGGAKNNHVNNYNNNNNYNITRETTNKHDASRSSGGGSIINHNHNSNSSLQNSKHGNNYYETAKAPRFQKKGADQQQQPQKSNTSTTPPAIATTMSSSTVTTDKHSVVNAPATTPSSSSATTSTANNNSVKHLINATANMQINNKSSTTVNVQQGQSTQSQKQVPQQKTQPQSNSAQSNNSFAKAFPQFPNGYNYNPYKIVGFQNKEANEFAMNVLRSQQPNVPVMQPQQPLPPPPSQQQKSPAPQQLPQQLSQPQQQQQQQQQQIQQQHQQQQQQQHHQHQLEQQIYNQHQMGQMSQQQHHMQQQQHHGIRHQHPKHHQSQQHHQQQQMQSHMYVQQQQHLALQQQTMSYHHNQNASQYGVAAGQPLQNEIWNYKIGDLCLAQYWEDGRYYNAEITGVSDKTCVVHFLEYGNYEEVLKNDCYPINTDPNLIPHQLLNKHHSHLQHQQQMHNVAQHHQMNQYTNRPTMGISIGGNIALNNNNKYHREERPMYVPPAQRQHK